MPLRMVAALGVALVLAASAGAASSRLGIVVVAVGAPGARSEATALAFAPGGKIVAGGDSASTSVDFALLRLKKSGTLDRTFGSGGKVTTSLARVSGITALDVQPDGKILAAGTGTTLFLVRYLSNGSLDPSFGTDGVVTGAGGTLALQPDGKIVTSRTTGLTRLLSNGAPDPSFDSGGTTSFPFGGAADVAVQRDGKIIATLTACEDICRLAVARFTARGILDPSFGSGGLTESIANFPTGLALAPDGGIVVTGGIGSPSAWRFRPDGSLDRTLATGGILVGGVAVQGDGKVVLAGSHFGDLALARYRVNGSLDPTFGRSGIAETRFGSSNSEPAAVAIQRDGRIVVAGASRGRDGTSSFVVARYTARGRLDRSFGPGCTVPKVIGLRLAKAKARITAAGCRTGAVASRKSARPRGRVIGQKPKPRTRVEFGSRVHLIVSR